MKKIFFVLFGKDTLQMIGLGSGGAYREHWSLEQHPGPNIPTSVLLGVPDDGPICYLHPRHLELLYARFRQANPGGVVLSDQDLIDHHYVKMLGRETFDRMMEEGGKFSVIDLSDEELEHPELRAYLPEIYEPETVRQMQADPWLDSWLLAEAIEKGHVPERRDCHPRWSPEWRAYCDRLLEARR